MPKRLFCIALFSLISLSIPGIATAQIVDIPDPNLRVAIEDELGKAPGATITVANMAALTILFAPNANISNLTGLQHATNLTLLDLGFEELGFEEIREHYINSNSISDLSPLAGLTNLEVLYLWSNSISDISAITGLTNLTTLWIDDNSISDISPLVTNIGLGQGDWVDVRENPLNDAAINTHIPTLESRGVWVWFDNIVVRPEDIAQTVDIPDPNLRAVIESWLGKDPGATITVVDMETLTTLSAHSTNLSDLTGLEHATNLTRLSFRITSISDISPLAELTKLTELDLPYNSISDISALTGLTQLTRLHLRGNAISDISAIAGLTNLENLWLEENSISDLSPLVENTGLGHGDLVEVGGNFLNALSINTHIPTLQSRGVTVGFDNIIVQPEDINQIVDIPDPALRAAINALRGKAPDATISVADMLTLIIFIAPNGNLSDLTGLEHATNLIWLDLNIVFLAEDFINNSVSDLSPLAGLTNLTHLWLGDNSISDISAVIGLTNLEFLYLADNSISDISPLIGLTQLTYLDIGDNSISDISPLVENTGLGNEDFVDCDRSNPLNCLIYQHPYSRAPEQRSGGIEFRRYS